MTCELAPRRAIGEPVTPDVTVLITCFNERHFVGEAIRSVVAQTAFDRISRILVIDDGSTDGSRTTLEVLAQELPKLEVQSIANVGLPAARNHGLNQVETPWVALLDGDDIWHPDKLERQLSAASGAREATALFYGDYVDFREDPGAGIAIRVKRYAGNNRDLLAQYFVHDGPIVPSSVLLRTGAVKAVGGFDASIALFEDTDFFLKLAAAGYGFDYVAGGLVFKRRREGSLSSRIPMWDAAMDECSRLWSKRRPELATLCCRRQSLRCAKIADAWFAAGDSRQGWNYLVRSMRLDPLNPRAYAYATLACVPRGARDQLRRAIRKVRRPAQTSASLQ